MPTGQRLDKSIEHQPFRSFYLARPAQPFRAARNRMDHSLQLRRHDL